MQSPFIFKNLAKSRKNVRLLGPRFRGIVHRKLTFRLAQWAVIVHRKLTNGDLLLVEQGESLSVMVVFLGGF